MHRTLLANRLKATFAPRLRRLRYLHRRSDCFRLERPSSPGGTCTRWTSVPLHGARQRIVTDRSVARTDPRCEWRGRIGLAFGVRPRPLRGFERPSAARDRLTFQTRARSITAKRSLKMTTIPDDRIIAPDGGRDAWPMRPSAGPRPSIWGTQPPLAPAEQGPPRAPSHTLQEKMR